MKREHGDELKIGTRDVLAQKPAVGARGQPSGREGQVLAWASKDRLNAYPMPPADIPLVAQLRDWL